MRFMRSTKGVINPFCVSVKGYIWVGVLPKEEKFCSKQQCVLVVHIVVPGGDFVVFIGHLVLWSRRRLLFLILDALGIKDVAI